MKTLLDREDLILNPAELGCVLSLTGLPGGSNKIHDRSPYGNTGTIVGATWIRLPSDLWVLSFDGSDDSVNCGNSKAFDITDQLSLELWLNKTGDGAGWPTLISKNYRYELLFIGTGDAVTPRCVFSVSGQTTGPAVNITRNIPTHIVMTLDVNAGANNWKIYKDGAPANQSTSPAEALGTDTGNLVLGLLGGAKYQGLLSLVRIYNRVLSALEIQNHFNREKYLFGEW